MASGARVEMPILKDAGYTYQGLPPSLAATADKFEDFAHARPAQDNGKVQTGRNPTTAAVSYPAKFFRKVPEEDELHTLTNAISTWAGPDGPFTKPELPRSAVDLVQKKQRQALELGLFKWIEENYDLENPVNVKYVMELWPEYFQKKMETIDEAIDLLKKVAHLNLMSGYIQPGDEETKQFVIALAMGYIDVDRRIMKYILPQAGDWDKSVTDNLVERGMFSPLQYPEDARGQIQGGLINLLKGSQRTKMLNMKPSKWPTIWDSFKSVVGGNPGDSDPRNPSTTTKFWGPG